MSTVTRPTPWPRWTPPATSISSPRGATNSTLATIYRDPFANGTVSNVAVVPGVSKATPGWVNFDADVSADGNTMYFVDGLFDASGSPDVGGSGDRGGPRPVSLG